MLVLRIGIVGNFPKPYGGVATTCYHQANQLIAAGHQVAFYDRNRHPEKHCPLGLKKYYVTATRKFYVSIRLVADIPRQWFTNKSFRLFFSHLIQDSLRYHLLTRYPATAFRMLLRSLEMLRTFEGLNIEILHGHHALHDAWALQLLAQYYFRCPFVVTVHTSEFTMQSNQPWRQMAIDVCNRADAVVCVSQYAQDCMFKAGVAPDRVVVSYHGVAATHFADPSEDNILAIRQRFRIYKNYPLILYTGWLLERKGPQVLLEALPIVEHLPWKAVFVGPDGGMKDILSSRIRALNLSERVFVSDAIPYDEHLALLSLAYVFVFPTLSLDEGFGLVALEAMAHGVPVIASRTGAIPEVVLDQSTGLFFNPGDVKELASCLQNMLTKPNLRSQMGESARAHAREFSWESNCARLVQTYEDVILYYAKSV